MSDVDVDVDVDEKAEVNRRSFLHGLGTFGGLGLVAGTALSTGLLGACAQDGLTTATATAPAGTGPRVTATSGSLGDLAGRLRGTLVLPDNPNYATARLMFTRRFQNAQPAAIAYSESEDDVRVSLQFAREHGVLFRARWGGHSYAGDSTTAGGLIIDVSRLSAVCPFPRPTKWR